MSTEDYDDSYEDKETMRETISREVDEFLAKGGEIQQCDPFVTTDVLNEIYKKDNNWMY